MPENGIVRDGGPVMFDSIAHRYDLLNRLLSMGFDAGWRKRAIRELDPQPGDRILDLCTGTGDFGVAALQREGRARVIGLDPARRMVRLGHRKVAGRGFGDRFAFGLADAEHLPLPDSSIDGALIAFGIRNVADRGRALGELARVIRTGGRLVILEFGTPANRLFRGVYGFYFRRILPGVGGLLSGNRAAYEYLPDSVGRFPAPEAFCRACREAGFARSAASPLTGGIVTLYVSVR